MGTAQHHVDAFWLTHKADLPFAVAAHHAHNHHISLLTLLVCLNGCMHVLIACFLYVLVLGGVLVASVSLDLPHPSTLVS
jgi:hypothetical protein